MAVVTPVRSARNDSKPAPTEAIPAKFGSQLVRIPLALIDIGDNVRVNVEAIDELAASIAEHGVLQPVKAVPDDKGAITRYRLVWGQRRVLAARQAGLTEIPAILERAPVNRSIEQLVENLHRADLNPIDRARAMREVIAAGLSQADLARKLGIAPSTVANDVGLLEAPAKIQELVEAGKLTPSHSKAMRGLAPKTQLELAKDAVERGYSAHRLEDEVQRFKRQAEHVAEQERKDAARRKENLAAIQAAVEALAAKPKPGLGTEIIVFQDYYGQGDATSKQLAELLRKAGFTNVRLADRHGIAQPRPSGGVCDCTAWKATTHSTYSYASSGYTTKLQATPACIVPKHRQAKDAVDEQKRRAQFALEERVQQHVRASAAGYATTALDDTPAIAIQRVLAEAALFSLLNYRLPTWSEEHGGKRVRPWQTIHGLSDDALATELAKAIAADFRDHAGYHVDWTTLATELGIEAPA